MTNEHIPFNRPGILGNELNYIRRAVESGVISGEGSFAERCHHLISETLGGRSSVLLTPSCTDALEMCALLLRLAPGDEVIMPSFTFVSTASAFALRGVRVRFADICPLTLNVDPASVDAAITERTKAIVVVHYGGVACDMDTILKLAERHGICVVEDAAHALGGTYHGRPLGSLGTLAAFSFHETKNVTCGEGGALVVNDSALVEFANIIRDKGTNRRAFQRGDAAFYTWVDIGSSFVMSDILAAFLYAQLEKLPEILTRRRAIYRYYQELLGPLRATGQIQFPEIKNLDEIGAHLFFVLAETPARRKELQDYLASVDISAVFHYQPLHQSPFAVATWGIQQALPIMERVAGRLLRLPMYHSLEENQVERICESVIAFRL